jgi:hypothetical protein
MTEEEFTYHYIRTIPLLPLRMLVKKSMDMDVPIENKEKLILFILETNEPLQRYEDEKAKYEELLKSIQGKLNGN